MIFLFILGLFLTIQNCIGMDDGDYQQIDLVPGILENLAYALTTHDFQTAEHILESHPQLSLTDEIGTLFTKIIKERILVPSLKDTLYYVHIFVLKKYVHLLNKLWSYGANMNALSARGSTPLYFATPDTLMIRTLLFLGADPNRGDPSSNPLVRCAAINNNAGATILVKHGSNINAQESHALLTALFHTNIPLIFLLLKNGAETNHVFYSKSFAYLPVFLLSARIDPHWLISFKLLLIFGTQCDQNHPLLKKFPEFENLEEIPSPLEPNTRSLLLLYALGRGYFQSAKKIISAETNLDDPVEIESQFHLSISPAELIKILLKRKDVFSQDKNHILLQLLSKPKKQNEGKKNHCFLPTISNFFNCCKPTG